MKTIADSLAPLYVLAIITIPSLILTAACYYAIVFLKHALGL